MKSKLQIIQEKRGAQTRTRRKKYLAAKRSGSYKRKTPALPTRWIRRRANILEGVRGRVPESKGKKVGVIERAKTFVRGLRGMA